MSKTYSNLILKLSSAVTIFQNRKRRALTRALTSEIMQIQWAVELDDARFIFHCPSSGALSAAQALDTQEPETRSWIREYVSVGDVVWDIGANIGLYSLYAAKMKSAKVYSFEPNAGTFAILVENIMLNSCSDKVFPLQIALSDRDGMTDLHLWRKGAGHALSAIGKPENIFGKFDPEGVYKCLAMKPETVATWPNLEKPDHIKIDVDGHELEILSASTEILNHVKSVCIELESSAPIASQKLKELLEAHGLQQVDEKNQENHRNSVFLRC